MIKILFYSRLKGGLMEIININVKNYCFQCFECKIELVYFSMFDDKNENSRIKNIPANIPI